MGKDRDAADHNDGTADSPALTEATAATDEDAPAQPADAPANGSGPGGMPESTLDENDPTTWPLLISFDKFVDGQTYQGYDKISIRPGNAVINEYLATQLIAKTGQPSEDSGFIALSVNDSATTTRPIIEIPDDAYADALGNGILFKAKSDSNFSYQGDAVETYEDQFKDINGDDDDDYQPLIALLKWLDEADDATFDAELADYVDVDSFAQYVATQNLLMNADDMAGPGKNYYLWYDKDTGLFSVIVWDLNSSMQGSTETDPTDDVAMGGGAPHQDAQNDAVQPPAGAPEQQGQAPTPPADGGGEQGNELKERFLASEKFQEKYLDTYWDLYEQMYGDGTAENILDNLADQLPASDSTTTDAISTAIQQQQAWVTQRKQYLSALQTTGGTGGSDNS